MAEKSWRNAELVVYEENMAVTAFWDALQSTRVVSKYAWILHDKDKKNGVDVVDHGHVMVQFKQPIKTGTICNKFGIRENQIEKIKGTWADALDYLTHANAPDKYQYDVSEVHANFDWETEARDSTHNQRVRLSEVLQGITDGTIRAYNMTEYISGEEYVRHRVKIKAAFEYRQNYVKSHLGELVEMKNIVWIYGETGAGKTTFAKATAKGYGLAYAMTSIGTNPFDDYLDEPCVIMDDLRPTDLRFNDLLGILDPYNFKHAAARYHNKALQTQLVIVTTTLSPERFATTCNGEELSAEDARQLYRRLNTVFEVTKQEVIMYEYDDTLTERYVVERYPNYWLMMAQRSARRKSVSVFDQMAEQAMGAYGSMPV